MTTAGNLSVESRCQKLKVNFKFCFRHCIFQNQVYNFFLLFHGSFRKICLFFFLEFLVIQMFVKKSTFALQILEKQLIVFAWPKLPYLDRHCLTCGNLVAKKTLAKENYITQLNRVLFINITKYLLYYILPRYAWNAVFLWMRPRREIYSTIFYLKHMKTGVPFDKHSYSMCERIAKLK